MALSAGKCDGGDGNEYDAICAMRAIFKGMDGGGIIYRKRGGGGEEGGGGPWWRRILFSVGASYVIILLYR